MIQVLANSAITAAIIILVGIGFGLIYQTGRFFHFAHGAVITVGAYFYLAFLKSATLPQWLSVFLAMLASGVLGCTFELAYRPLRKRRASGIVLLLASLGIYIVLVNMISLIFGEQTQSVRIAAVVEGFEFFTARLTRIQVLTIICAAIVAPLIAAMLKITSLGKQIRAVSSDPELARVMGVQTGWIMLATFSMGSVIAGLAGILISMDVDMRPTMGLLPLMAAVVAVIAGGVGNVSGLILGAVLIAVAQNFGGWYLGQHWRDVIVFIVLVVFMLTKPESVLRQRP
jgi:branched-chain amino acid transport system permease protein